MKQPTLDLLGFAMYIKYVLLRVRCYLLHVLPVSPLLCMMFLFLVSRYDRANRRAYCYGLGELLAPLNFSGSPFLVLFAVVALLYFVYCTVTTKCNNDDDYDYCHWNCNFSGRTCCRIQRRDVRTATKKLRAWLSSVQNEINCRHWVHSHVNGQTTLNV